MKLDVWHKILAGAAVAALALAALSFRSWLSEHDARILSQATQQAQEKVLQAAQQQQEQLVAQEKARDQATAEQLAAMQKLVAQVRTPQQIASWIPQQLQTPQPIKIEVPQPTATNPVPAAVATIPQADLPALRDEVESCKICSVRLQTAQQDLASKDQQLKLAGEKLSAAEQQRDAALKAAHGTFWGRLWMRTKWLVIGAGVGAAVLCGSGRCK